MSEAWTCVECEALFSDEDGDLDARTCQKCLDSFESERLGSLRFYLKQRGGDPRNHEWYEVSETMFDLGGVGDGFFKKILSAEYSDETTSKLLKGK